MFFKWTICSRKFQSTRKPLHPSSLKIKSRFKREGTYVYLWLLYGSSVQSFSQTLCNPMDCSMPSLPVHHQLPEFIQIYVHWVCDAIQQSHLLSSPSLPIFNISQHQGLFKWVSSSHQVAKVLEFQLQYQSFQWKSGLISLAGSCLCYHMLFAHGIPSSIELGVHPTPVWLHLK